MAASFDKLKHLNANTEHLVFGFCRSARQSESLPSAIVQLVTLFFWAKHKWFRHEDYLEQDIYDIDDDSGMLTRTAESASQSVFLDTTFSRGVHSFTFKAVHFAEPDREWHDLTIGIISERAIRDGEVKGKCLDMASPPRADWRRARRTGPASRNTDGCARTVMSSQ